MQPESLGLYLRMGYDPVASFGVFSDEPDSRCFGKWLRGPAAPADPSSAEPASPAAPAATARPEIREVPWADPGAAALRRAMWAFHQERYPELVRDVEARGGHDAVDAERGQTALTTFVATLDGRPVGCATVAPSLAGPEHLVADPLRGVGGLAVAAPAESGDALGSPRGLEMRTVFVDPAARRAGVATALVRQAEAEARSRGALALYLGTGIRQPEALRLYVKLGYRPVLPYPPHDNADEPLLLFLGKPL